MRENLLILFMLAALGGYAQSLQAAFSANEAKVAYYTMGWDSEAEFDTWTYTDEGESGWELGATPYTSGAVTFDKIETLSLSSLLLHYGYQQNATATSPEITVKPESNVEFYSFASGIFLYSGAWKFYVVDSEDNMILLLDQFLWAQEKGYDGPSWELFSVDLADYVGQTVRFRFVYEGTYGEDEAIDGFKVCQTATDESAKINIKVGASVHFTDMTVASEGVDLQWAWTFEGGTPASSTERNPVVTYGEEGVFSVTLSVSDNNGNTSSITRNSYVIVTAEAPIAKIGIPDGAYLSPWVMMFVPVSVPLTFPDLSTGFPDEWLWHFYGTDITTSTLQNPTVTYTEAGTYGLRLDVANNAGTSTDSLINTAIQAGGEQFIWNIAPEENGDLGIIDMSWYGNYGGTNWLGIPSFAERYAAPAAPAVIDRVTVYLGKLSVATPKAKLTLRVMTEGEDGLPGEVLSTTELTYSELKYSDNTFEETVFVLPEPVAITGAFFVAIDGFYSPKAGNDDIALFLCRRKPGEKSTSYQYVLDEGPRNTFLSTGKWYLNEEDPVSLAIAPHLAFNVLAVSGDVNSDGSVNAGDVSSVYNVMLGTESDADVIKRADVNADGSVNAGDVSSVYSIILQ